MTGFEAAFSGRSLGGLPASLAEALARFSGQSVTLGLRQGKPEARAEALNLLANEQGDRSRQLQYVQIMGEVRVPVRSRPCSAWDAILRTMRRGPRARGAGEL